MSTIEAPKTLRDLKTRIAYLELEDVLIICKKTKQ